MKRQVAVLTVGRSDFGRYLPVLRALRDMPGIDLQLYASGGHFSSTSGRTVSEIEAAGFDWLPGYTEDICSDKPLVVGRAIGLGTDALSHSFAEKRPDLVVVLGDRFEMLAGGCAAIGFGLPVFHIHGGAVTEGAIDELVRHALTKMSHLHLVSCEDYAKRLRQMGEEPWRIHVTGAPGLDDLAAYASMPLDDLSQAIGLDLSAPTLLLCYHPATLEIGQTERQISDVLEAVRGTGLQTVVTYPNLDPGHETIVRAIEAFAAANPETTVLAKNIGTQLFSSLLSRVSALVGNSSSGIVEAATFKLPVVNVGSRQDGKLRAINVIDVDSHLTAIRDGLARAVQPAFRDSLENLVNPYGDAKSGPRIAEIIATQELDAQLMRKKFIDL